MEPDLPTPESGNAYAPPNPLAEPLPGPVVAADAFSSSQSSAQRSAGRPRMWTVFAVVAASIVLFLTASLFFSLLAILVVHGRLDMATLSDPQNLADVSRSRIGLFIMVVMPQFALVVPAVVAAFASPTPVTQRLSLVRGHWPVWVWFAAALATPLVGLFSSMVCGLFLSESEGLKAMSEIFRDHGASGFLIPLSLMIGLTPAICEELLFRGYVQTRLTKTMHPLLGILIASFLFAVFHLDYVHVIAVFPMGVFLGWVSWRSGSLVPAMLGHFVNNVISVVAVVYAPDGEADVFAAPVIAISAAILSLGIVGMSATVTASIAYGPPPTQSPPTEPPGIASAAAVA